MNYYNHANSVLEELKNSLLSIDDSDLEQLIDCILSSPRVFCDGKGRSGLQVNAFAMRLAQMGRVSYVVSETTTPSISKDDVLIISSGSGETPSLVEHAKKASEVGAKIALITTDTDSTIRSMSDYAVAIDSFSKMSKSDQSMQPMGTLFEQTVGLLFDIMVLLIMQKQSITNDDMYRLHNNLE